MLMTCPLCKLIIRLVLYSFEVANVVNIKNCEFEWKEYGCICTTAKPWVYLK